MSLSPDPHGAQHRGLCPSGDSPGSRRHRASQAISHLRHPLHRWVGSGLGQGRPWEPRLPSKPVVPVMWPRGASLLCPFWPLPHCWGSELAVSSPGSQASRSSCELGLLESPEAWGLLVATLRKDPSASILSLLSAAARLRSAPRGEQWFSGFRPRLGVGWGSWVSKPEPPPAPGSF